MRVTGLEVTQGVQYQIFYHFIGSGYILGRGGTASMLFIIAQMVLVYTEGAYVSGLILLEE
jgi:hypothetical protein